VTVSFAIHAMCQMNPLNLSWTMNLTVCFPPLLHTHAPHTRTHALTHTSQFLALYSALPFTLICTLLFSSPDEDHSPIMPSHSEMASMTLTQLRKLASSFGLPWHDIQGKPFSRKQLQHFWGVQTPLPVKARSGHHASSTVATRRPAEEKPCSRKSLQHQHRQAIKCQNGSLCDLHLQVVLLHPFP
jgi:hypothetical protein